MLFEPCGDLRRDYSAYCETLRLTEREDVYSAVHTSTELAEARAAEAQAASLRAAHTTAPDRAHCEVDHAESLSISHTLGPVEPSTPRLERPAATPASAATSSTPTAAEAKPSKAVTKRSSRASAPAATGPPPAAVPPAGVSEEAPDGADAGPPLVSRPNLFFLRLRHPGFCINQRDMTPLCRAIPHCPSLVSIELVGCGLSVESYLLLVEAVFKSRRVVAITVDFNNLPQPGFLKDPTVLTPPTPSRQTSVTASAAPMADEAAATRGDQTPTPPSSALATPRSSSASGRPAAKGASAAAGLKKKRSTKVSTAAASAEAAAAAAAAALAKDRAEPGAIFLKPTEFCGLHTLRSPLEDQIQEEHEKKGKVDPKKLSLLQQQNDTINALNVAHRIKLPRSWEGILFTGVRHLSLRGNGITDDVVERMIALLLQHPYSQLIALNLWGNAITDRGAGLLAHWLRHTDRRLRALDLGRNHIGDAGLLELTDVFRMRELTSMEEVATYRQQVLTRPGATAQERAAASTPMPTAYPSYQELYNAWFIQTYPEAAEEVVAAAAMAAGGAGAPTSGNKAGAKDGVASGGAAAAGAAAGGKRGAAAAGVKGKSAKAAAEVLPTLARPTTPFDRHCVRVVSGSDVLIRVPGNTVLEVLNLCENTGLTRDGASEAARRLHLHEPATDAEMKAMAGDSFYSAFVANGGAGASSQTSFHAAGAPQRESRLVSVDVPATDSAPASATAMDAVLGLARPIPTDGSSLADGRRRSSRKSSTSTAQSPPHREGSLSTPSPRHDKSKTTSPRTSTARRVSAGLSPGGSTTTVVHGGPTLSPAQVTTPELHCADVRLRSFGLFTHRYDAAPHSALSAVPMTTATTTTKTTTTTNTTAGVAYGSTRARTDSPERAVLALSTASTAVYTPAAMSTNSAVNGPAPLPPCGAAQADWQVFAHLQQSMNAALGTWGRAAEAAAPPTSLMSGNAGAAPSSAADEDGKSKKHGSSSGRPGSGREAKTATPS